MRGFTFTTTPRIISQLGGSALVADVMQQLGCRRVGIVTDKGVRAARLLSPAMDSLDQAGMPHFVYDEVTADPPLRAVLDAADWAKDNALDGVIGFGGGSPLDVAKLVA